MPSPLAKPAAARLLEKGLFLSRWLMAPFYVGLVIALLVLLAVFVGEIVHEAPRAAHMRAEDAILLALSMIDLSLAANLVLIVTFAGYENFVTRFELNEEARPEWMGKVDFSGLKMKLMTSIVAISAIALLRAFMELEEGEPIQAEKLYWLAAIHLTFVVSGVLLALMDWIASKTWAH